MGAEEDLGVAEGRLTPGFGVKTDAGLVLPPPKGVTWLGSTFLTSLTLFDPEK